METRSHIRKRILVERDRLTIETRKEKSDLIRKKLMAFQQVQGSDVFFCYVNFRGEVETQKIITELLKMGKKVAVPLTLEKQKKLLAINILDIDEDLEPGYQAIPEPRKNLIATSCIDPGKIDTIILPGSVFDRSCGRMGYGGGFYDRFIAHQAPKAIRIGICFDMQLVEKVMLEPHDKRMDYIITESQIVKRSVTEGNHEKNSHI